jgi:hypothetical protein
LATPREFRNDDDMGRGPAEVSIKELRSPTVYRAGRQKARGHNRP